MSEDAARIDLWLWHARFFKTRALAAEFCGKNRIRLTRPGQSEVRVDKPSRTIRPGDQLVFAIGKRLVAIEIQSIGERRGPAFEAQLLYRPLNPGDNPT